MLKDTIGVLILKQNNIDIQRALHNTTMGYLTCKLVNLRLFQISAVKHRSLLANVEPTMTHKQQNWNWE